MAKSDPPAKVASNAVLGPLPPQRAGQARMMTIIDAAEETETGHWFSPDGVQERIDAAVTEMRMELSLEAHARQDERGKVERLRAQLAITARGLKHCAGWNISEDTRNALMAVVLESEALLPSGPNVEVSGRTRSA